MRDPCVGHRCRLPAAPIRTLVAAFRLSRRGATRSLVASTSVSDGGSLCSREGGSVKKAPARSVWPFGSRAAVGRALSLPRSGASTSRSGGDRCARCYHVLQHHFWHGTCWTRQVTSTGSRLQCRSMTTAAAALPAGSVGTSDSTRAAHDAAKMHDVAATVWAARFESIAITGLLLTYAKGPYQLCALCMMDLDVYHER